MAHTIGAPTFERAFLKAALSVSFTALRRLSRMRRGQQRLVLLRMSLSKRIQHIQRLIPTRGPRSMPIGRGVEGGIVLDGACKAHYCGLYMLL